MLEPKLGAMLQNLYSGKNLNISDSYWSVISEIDEEGALFARLDLFAANALLLSNREMLFEKYSEHAFTEHHGGRMIKKAADEYGAEHTKIMHRHGDDEIRHGHLFIELLNSLGHDISSDVFGPDGELNQYYSDIYAEWGGDLFSFLCFMHAAEVRTMCHVHQILSISKSYGSDDMKLVAETFQTLYDDEKFHLRYTAKILSEFFEQGRSPDVLRDAFSFVNAQTQKTINTAVTKYNRLAGDQQAA